MPRSHALPYLPQTRLQRALSPFARFIHMESAGGLVLIACTVVALFWANSSWAESYHRLWETPFAVQLGPWALELSLHGWINDGLMAVFFLLVGLEIKREVLAGELASRKRAALPIAAALGGMLVPAAIYSLLNAGGAGARGWGIPMATDIAFALGVLTLMGPRVPTALKVFLTALAIADDLGAVVVIAFFYTQQLAWGALGGAVLAVMACLAANWLGIRRPVIYIVLGAVLWACLLASGIHSTVAGVLLAMCIPVRTRINPEHVLQRGRRTLDDLDAGRTETSLLANRGQQDALLELERLCEAGQSPSLRIEHELQDVVAFGIVPLFALSNAGVSLSGGAGAVLTQPVTLGVILGLVFGKPIGITLFSWLAVRLHLAELPAGTSWRALHAVSWLGGIGFTMSLFVTGLSFPDGALASGAKLGILIASVTASAAGWIILRRARVLTGTAEAAGPLDSTPTYLPTPPASAA